ncbi:MAG: archaeal flagellar protein FlaJ [Methanofollis sp.]|nr:archaeal flagellar protein FlaJ [Methanofollis sp.]
MTGMFDRIKEVLSGISWRLQAEKETQKGSVSLRERVSFQVDRLQMRYDLKREYFTIGVPVAVAILFVVGAILLGVAGGEDEQAPQQSDKLAAYEDLVRQMEAEEAGGALPVETEARPVEEDQPPPLGYDRLIIIAFLIAITPYAFDITLQKRRLKKKESLFVEFLFKLSEMMRGGLDPIKSVKELAKSDLGVLTPHIRMASNEMLYGKSFEEAMRSMGDSIGGELVRRYTELVIQASHSGGSVADLILRSSEDMRSIINLDREKASALSQFILIFYFAQGIIVFIAYTLNSSLLPFLTGGGTGDLFGENKIQDIDFPTGFFHLIMINAFFGGLVIGKISEGEVRFGLKHVVILMVGCYIASNALFFSVAETGPDVTLDLISGGDVEGIGGLPLEEPLIFLVRNPDGDPVEGVTVSFSILPGGSVTSSDISGDDGQVKALVTPGDVPGVYTVTATAGTAVCRATVVAAETGDG